MKLTKAYTFDDLLLVPQYSEVLPAETILKTSLTKKIEIDIPIISAAMDTVTELDMARTMYELGGASVIHKNMSAIKQAELVKKVKTSDTSKSFKGAVGGAVGTSDEEFERAKLLIDAGVDFIVVDTAHGHSKKVLDMVERIRNKYDIEIIAGNIATKQAGEDLIKRGASALKVGIGPGSICTTRIVAGVGVPQITAILNVVEVADKHDIPVIADGGIKYSGDVVKALAVGASTVMLGSLLAGTDEAPGEVLVIDGKKYKSYRGMGSLAAMEKGSSDRYFQSKKQGKFVPEGVEGLLEYKGSVKDIVYQLVGGLRSGMGYLGAKSISDLKKRAEFVEISSQGLKESHAHDVIIAKKAPNY